ncbi:hypothetical protein DEU37_1626 [Microbacterium sp. AG790]|uniref:hypothetical protein n=1 Tax=Microbacterium sp. AG790 TaxID=2183995 RepID=UPI000EB31C78|nr:hypothetical protein [Microbacterium sp. AG790]RKS89313.1 hypothetical protein DEU37_1626 [Microbacterium sp. AG790]
MQRSGAPDAQRRRACASLGAALVVAALAGCAPTPPPPAPAGIAVSVQQNRLDIARGKMTVVVHNGGASAVTLTSLVYADARWASVLEWTGALPVPAGRARSVTADLMSPACATSPTDVAGTAHLVFQTDRGAASDDYGVDDPFGFVARAAQQGCFASRFAATAAVDLVDVAVVTGAGAAVAELTVRIVNHGAAPVRLDTVKSTTLLQPAAGGWLWEPAQVVAAGESVTVRLEAAPARCDLHAIAEDKVGTRFEAAVSVLSDPIDRGSLTLVASDPQRARLYDFVATTCGFAP